MIDAFKEHPMTFCILALYVSNVLWYSYEGKPGLAFYWLAAAQITVAATWLRSWSW
tara:strand:+ start:87 stop:254 length:168 start_codon:yes stop_codon:yes gene_type:complete